MITVTLGHNTERKNVIVSTTATIRQILEENDIDYSVGSMYLDGASLQTGAMDKTLPELGITTKCVLINVAKADCA